MVVQAKEEVLIEIHVQVVDLVINVVVKEVLIDLAILVINATIMVLKLICTIKLK